MRAKTQKAALRIAIPLLAFAGCSAGRHDASSSLVGTATAAVNLAPGSALCLQLQVTGGGAMVTSTFALTNEASTTFLLGGLPLGVDAFAATAFGVACSKVELASPTWVSNPVVATVTDAAQVQVSLVMLPATDGGAAVVGASFPECAPAITEFPTSLPPQGIVAGSDGNLWFTEDSFASGQTIDVTFTTLAVQITPGGVTSPAEITALPGDTTQPEALPTDQNLCVGPDGKTWFTEYAGGLIGQIQPNGVPAVLIVPGTSSGPYGIAAGPDGNLWVTMYDGNTIAQMTVNALITAQFPLKTNGSAPRDIVAGPDGRMWFTESGNNAIGAVAQDGGIQDFPVPTEAGVPYSLAAGQDGDLWFTEMAANKIGRITTNGVVSKEFVLPTARSGPAGIVAGPDGNLWFTESAVAKIGRITTSGAVTEFTLSNGRARPSGITVGPDGNLWFVDRGTPAIGRITPYILCASDGGADAGDAVTALDAGSVVLGLDGGPGN
jgi:streptogramin lyase